MDLQPIAEPDRDNLPGFAEALYSSQPTLAGWLAQTLYLIKEKHG